MAEFFGIVAGVLGLLSLCHDGLEMIREIFDAQKTLELAVGRVELQRDRYNEWRAFWRDDNGVPDVEFEKYAKSNLESAKEVLCQLALLSQALFDARVLESEYGIKPFDRSIRESKDLSQFNLEDAQNFPIEFHVSFIQRCKFNMAIIKRSKIVINKRDTSWNALIDLLRKCIDCLSTYGPKFEVEILAKSGFNILEKMIKTELRRRADAAAYEDQHMSNENGDVDRYNNLSLAAQFCEVVRYERKKTPHKFSMQDFKFDPKYQLSSDSTMALLYEHPVTPNSTEHRVILIEWTKDLDHHQKRDTKIKAIILASPKPRQLLLPFCYGVVEDPATHRWGLVLAPPAHIGSNLPVKLPTGSISQYRMPVSLKDLLERKHPSYMHTLSLGIRFRLAKKLVGAIHMMHCIGWVHKNISSDTILFFPAAQPAVHGGVGPVLQEPQALGFDDPLLVGLGLGDSKHPRFESDLLEAIPNPSLTSYDDTRQNGILSQRQNDTTSLDYYQHPSKRWNPSTRYSRAHAIYSLGCVLLEIGLWRPLEEVADVSEVDYDKVVTEFQELAARDLDGMMGSIYGSVVKKCLSLTPRDGTEAAETRSLLRFCSEIAASLESCCA